MKILVCPDSFKGTLTACEAAEAMARGVKDVMPQAEVASLPIGDGGEGTVDALAASLPDVEVVECDTVDPLRRPIKARYIVSCGKAYIESAAASGLTLLTTEERDVMNADTYGTGLLLADAYRRGIRDITVGMGGTATCDGGFGAYEAFSAVAPPMSTRDCRIMLLCDVTNPLLGTRGAATVFAPQKGASECEVPLLELKLGNKARFYRRFRKIDVSSMKYAGAAGGLAGMLMACYGAHPESGIMRVLQILDFPTRLECPGSPDLVITGEGRADATTLEGKAPSGVLQMAREAGVSAALIAGLVSDRETFLNAGFKYVEQASPEDGTAEMFAAEYVRRAAANVIKRMGIEETGVKPEK